MPASAGYQPEPRYDVRTLKNENGSARRLGVYDNHRGSYVRRLPLATPERLVHRVIEELERTFRPASVIYREKRTTRQLNEPWEYATLHGDIVEVTPKYRIVLDNGRNLHTVPSSRHVRTIWGTTVVDHAPNPRDGFRGAIVTERPDHVEGWSEPRHQELYHLVHNGSVEPWFAAFALRFGLAGKHWQWDEMVQAGHTVRPLNANGAAQWLLRHWDREHPDVTRRLYA